MREITGKIEDLRNTLQRMSIWIKKLDETKEKSNLEDDLSFAEVDIKAISIIHEHTIKRATEAEELLREILGDWEDSCDPIPYNLPERVKQFLGE